MANEYEVDVLKRNYLRSIMCQSRVRDSAGILVRAFLDESYSAKKARLENDYKGHVEFLDVPIAELDMDIISRFSGADVPESYRDIWIKLLT